jgi:hypothetical protein
VGGVKKSDSLLPHVVEEEKKEVIGTGEDEKMKKDLINDI